MNNAVEVQLAHDDELVPDGARITAWVDCALKSAQKRAVSITVRVVTRDEMQNLNDRFRGQNSATNVLSFPSDNLGSQRTGVSGDIVVCSAVVQTEAQEQNKATDAHWAHIIIHGVLHLCGYDHTTDAVATDMESLEVLILRQLGFPDPYQIT